MIRAALEEANRPFISAQCDTFDVDEHAACLRDWGQIYDQLTPGAFRGSFEEVCFGNLQLFREQLNQSAHETGMPWMGSRTVGVVSGLEGQGWFCGKEFGADSIIDMQGGCTLDFRTPRQHEILVAVVNEEALIDYAIQVEHLDLTAQQSACGVINADPARAAKLRSFLSSVLASVRATPQMLVHEELRKALEHAVFSALLGVVAFVSDEPAPPSGRARQNIVERARGYIREHIAEPISVEDLCINLQVSRRTLQYSFQDVLNLNPVKFLRAMRLNGVRRALKNAAPDRNTVADVAASWGLWHLSHFSAEYKKMFGELPSETLRRAA